MVLDCVADAVTNFLVDLLDVRPALGVSSGVRSIVFLQIN